MCHIYVSAFANILRNYTNLRACLVRIWCTFISIYIFLMSALVRSFVGCVRWLRPTNICSHYHSRWLCFVVLRRIFVRFVPTTLRRVIGDVLITVFEERGGD